MKLVLFFLRHRAANYFETDPARVSVKGGRFLAMSVPSIEECREYLSNPCEQVPYRNFPSLIPSHVPTSNKKMRMKSLSHRHEKIPFVTLYGHLLSFSPKRRGGLLPHFATLNCRLTDASWQPDGRTKSVVDHLSMLLLKVLLAPSGP